MSEDWQHVKDILRTLGLSHAGFSRTDKKGFWEVRVDRGWMDHQEFQILIESKFILHGLALEGPNWFAYVEVRDG